MNKDGLFGVYVNTKTFTLNQLNPNVVLLNHRCYFKINDEHDYYHGHGFTNMKIEGDYKLLEKISFFMGNEYIEAIYPKKNREKQNFQFLLITLFLMFFLQHLIFLLN